MRHCLIPDAPLSPTHRESLFDQRTRDLVEAQWNAHGARRTFVVAFVY